MKYILRLYVADASQSSVIAIANLQKIAERLAGQLSDIEIIDVVKNPELAVMEHIIATPVLIKAHPPPVLKIIGDLSNTGDILLWIGEYKDAVLPTNAGKENNDERI